MQIQCLELLVHLAESDTDATVDACQIAGQGLFWQPHMFIYTLRKRHHDCPVIVELAARLHEIFSNRLPVTSPIQLDTPPRSAVRTAPELGESGRRATSPSTRQTASPVTLPSIHASRPGTHSPQRPLHSPTTTISTLYWEAPSPYSPTRLPITRPVTSPAEQVRRSTVFSTPKRAAVEGDRFQRCCTPNATEPTRPQTQQNFPNDELDEPGSRKVRSLDPLDAAAKKKKTHLSENYSWNPETLNSASGFEWWWRTLPEDHASLEPTEKLKAVAKAAVRMHTSGNWHRAIDLYQLALSLAQGSENTDVEFRLRVNLACAFEAEEDLEASKTEFEAALSISPNDTYARFKLGTVIAAMGNFDRAEMELKSVLPVYPEAEKALQQVQEARLLYQRQEEERRVATAAAKAARRQSSPRPKTRPNPEPTVACPPSTEKPQGSPSYRSSRQATKAASRTSPPEPTNSNDSQPDSPPVPSPRVVTSTVATSTEEEIPSDLFERILLCCVKHHLEFQTLVRSMDIKSCGLIRLESLVTLLCIIGIEISADAIVNELQISPAQLESIQGHDFIRYPSLLRVYNEKQINRASRSAAIGVSDMMSRLVDLVQQERSFYVHNFAESKADEWLSAGTQMTVLRLQTSPTKQTFEEDLSNPEATQVEGPRGTDVDQENISAASGAPESIGRLQRLKSSHSCELPALMLVSLPGVADDANTSMASARMQQKQEQILRAETERVLARKHMHCLKSLRSIAARARKHQEEKHAALLYLRDFAANARQELAHRHHRTAAAPDTPIAIEQLELQYARDLATSVYAQSVETAVHHIEEMQQLQSLAQEYAAMSQVPTHWLPDAGMNPASANDTQS